MAKKKNPAGGQLSTKLVYLDLDVIMANYRNPEFWGKKWTIYKHRQFEIYWQMVSINFQDHVIKSEVRMESFSLKNRKNEPAKHWYDSSWSGQSCRSIPLNHKEYTQEVFMKNILGSCLSLVAWVERTLIQQYAEYKTAQQLEDDHNEKLTEIAKSIADAYVISGGEYSSTIKEAFVEKYVDDNSADYTSAVVNNYNHKVLGSLYVMLCSWFNDEERFEQEKLQLGDGKKKHIWLDMFLKNKEIQTEEWQKAMEEECKKLVS